MSEPGITVYEEVGGEGGTALETLPALLTLEQLLSAVNGSEERKYYKTKYPVSSSHLCWFRLISWPKVLLQSSQANGLETMMRPTFILSFGKIKNIFKF